MMTSLQQQEWANKATRTSHKSHGANSYPSRTIVHAKLEMTEPGDHDEQEANAVANAVVNDRKIVRKISTGGGGSSGIAVSPQMESQLSQLQGGGRQMPESLRNMMESGFGQDFSQVRLHTDSEAASMSSSIHAKAFTLGNDIYFNQGQFSPNTTEGQRLVAHELTHVVQGTGKVGRDPYSGPTIGPDQSQTTKTEGMTGEEFVSILIEFKGIVESIKAFHDLKVGNYIDDIILAIQRYNIEQVMEEGVKKAKLAQSGQGAAKTVNIAWKGINIIAWVFSTVMDIKRVMENRNSKGVVYYIIRALLTLADCPFAPWPPHIKLAISTFNTASGIGDLYGAYDGDIVHPYRRAKMVGDTYGGPDSVTGLIGFGIGSIPVLGELGEWIGAGAAAAYLGLTGE